MKILDKYILKETLGPFFFGLLCFGAILAGSTILIPLISEAAKHQIPVFDTIKLFCYQLPNIIAFSFPMAMLLSAILCFGRLSSDLEITGFRSNGIPFIRLIIPVICVGFIVSIISILFNESIVPNATHRYDTLLRSYQHSNTPKIKKNINFTEYDLNGHPQRIINVRELDKRTLKGITIAEYDQGNLSRVVNAKSGNWLSEGAWEFFNGHMHYFPISNKKSVFFVEFEKEYIDIKLDPINVKRQNKSVESMNAKELKKRINYKIKMGQGITEDQVKYYLKFSVPFASLIFAILGSCIGIRPHRQSSTIGLGISILIIISYYFLIGIGIGLSYSIPPIIGAWMPNIVIGLLALSLLNKMAYE